MQAISVAAILREIQTNGLSCVFMFIGNKIRLYTSTKSLYNIVNNTAMKEGERMIEMPTDLQVKNELRKEEINVENELEMLHNKEYDRLEKKLERDLQRIRKSLED